MTANGADTTVNGRRIKFTWWYHYFIVQCCMRKSLKRKMILFKIEFQMAIDESQWGTNWRKQWLGFWIGCQGKTCSVQQELDLTNIRLNPHTAPPQKHVSAKGKRGEKPHIKATTTKCNVISEWDYSTEFVSQFSILRVEKKQILLTMN